MVGRIKHWGLAGLAWIALAGGVSAGPLSSADPAWASRVWQMDDGLPGNEVTGVEQTEDGYLWLGTPRGLVRFDGVQFQHVSLPGFRSEGDPLIRGMTRTGDNHLWLALEGSLAVCFTPGPSNQFKTVEGLSHYRPLAPVEDGNGAVWIGYSDGSAWRIRAGQVKQFTAREGLTGVGYCRLAKDKGGRLWFAKAGRVGVFQDEKFQAKFTVREKVAQIAAARDGGIWVCTGWRLYKYGPGTNGPALIGQLIKSADGVEPSAMFEDRAGALWMGTSTSGLFRYDGTNITRVATSHESITSLMEDREQCIWVGTAGGGLDRLLPRVVTLEDETTGLPFETVRSVTEDAAGALWAVGESGVLARQERGRWSVVGTNTGLPNAVATCVTGGAGGEVWVGTYLGGLCRWRDGTVTSWKRADGLASDIVRALFVDSRGDLWIGLESNASVQRYHDGQFQTFPLPVDNPIRTMAEDRAGNIWMATSGGDLFRVTDNQLIDETRRYHSPIRPIRSLCTTPDGSLWIGYSGAGVGRLRDEKFALIGREQGLYDEYICSLIADGAGGIWFASDRGIFQVRQSELDAVAEGRARQVFSMTYGRDQALPNLEANYGYMPGVTRGRDGRLGFAMRRGLAVAQPARVRSGPATVPLRIERAVVDDRELDLGRAGSGLKLPAGYRNLEIDFTALSYVSPENLRFRHQLEGWDEGWQKEDSQRSVTYSRLPPGEYVFRMTARTEAPGWSSPEATVRFRVEPFLWQTWWFRLGGVMVLGMLFAAGVRQYERRKHQRELERIERHSLMERERARVAQDLHDDLGAGLTEIGLIGAIAQRDNVSAERAQTHLRQITGKANEMVVSLDEIVWAINPRHDSVVSLSHYFCEYAQRFLELTGIRCRMEVAKDLPEGLLTSEQRHGLFLAFKEALTNVVRHAQATEVWIKISVRGRWLRVTVADNGQGLAAPAAPAAGPGEGDGLSNMVRRLELMGGRCEVESTRPGGTSVRFVFPLPGEGGE